MGAPTGTSCRGSLLPVHQSPAPPPSPNNLGFGRAPQGQVQTAAFDTAGASRPHPSFPVQPDFPNFLPHLATTQSTSQAAEPAPTFTARPLHTRALPPRDMPGLSAQTHAPELLRAPNEVKPNYPPTPLFPQHSTTHTRQPSAPEDRKDPRALKREGNPFEDNIRPC